MEDENEQIKETPTKKGWLLALDEAMPVEIELVL
jgi:hypothetical protein